MRYTKPDLLEFNQNTIDDFYPTTKSMIDGIIDLICTKMDDFLKEGKIYTKSMVMEAFGGVARYVKTFAYGHDFQGDK